MIAYVSNVQDPTQSHYRIFCDFHEKDMAHFLKIKSDIFELCKCSLYYYDQADKGCDEAELKFTLERSNLYVLIVSSRVLFDSDFDKRAFDAAVEAKIPILPILVENGLEAAFNEKFGNIQCISTCLELVDPTAVPYVEKLQNFLNQSLHLSFEIDTLRKAFDATIFLSYRKKDRKYAQKLLDVIHSSDALKNIAVWYDEFLVPGEDFNESIKAELENSALFVLMVTPSILEDQNYIQLVEYPIARDLQKSILPVETVQTCQEVLKEAFPEIPETVSVLDPEQLKKVIERELEKNGISICERTALRDFFIGFAFLKGLCVEKNTAIAMEMIKRSADTGVPEAIATLVSMYKYGDGCPVDTQKAVHWQNQYIAQALACFQADATKENAQSVLAAYRELADIFVRGENIAAAADAFMEIVRFLETSPIEDACFIKLHSAQAYESAARLLMDAGDYVQARYDYIHKAIELRKDLCASPSVEKGAVDLINGYLLLAECQSKSDDIIGLKKTIKVDLKEIGNKLLEYRSPSVASQPLEFLQKVLSGLNAMGQYYDQLNMEEQAFIFIGAGVNLAEAINIRYNNLSTNMLAYSAFLNDGRQHVRIEVENHLQAAHRSFTDAYDAALNLLNKSETLEFQLIVAESCVNLALVNHKLKNAEAAEEYLKKALEMYETLFDSVHTIPAKQKLYQSYYIAAEIYGDLKRTEEAGVMLDKGLAINDAIVQASPLAIYKLEMADALRKKGDMLKKQWEFDEALDCYAQRHQLILEGAHKNIHILLIAESYQTLIAAHKSVGNMQEAKELSDALGAFKRKYDNVFSGHVTFYK